MIFKLYSPPDSDSVTLNKVGPWGQTVGKVTVPRGTVAKLYRTLGRGSRLAEFLLPDGSVVRGFIRPNEAGRAPLYLWVAEA